MSYVRLAGNAAGTGVIEITTPNTNTNRSLTLPDAAGAIVIDSATQTLTNKTINGGAITTTATKTYNWNGASTNTYLDFDIPSWVKRITVAATGVSLNGSAGLLVQIGSGSLTTTGYIGVSCYLYGGTSSGATTATNGMPVHVGAAANVSTGHMWLTLTNSNSWVQSHCMGMSNVAVSMNGSGSVTLSGTIDRLRFTTTNGTDVIDSGSVTLLYE